MLTIGIVGAGGFIGCRTSEVFHHQTVAKVRPIVRTLPTIGILNQLGVRTYTADAENLFSLKLALAGCDVVVHCTSGSPWSIRRTAEITYKAANQVGVKRLVYLSTASVHGQAPPSYTNEQTALCDHQFYAYNNAKVQAERLLLRLRHQGDTEVVIVRPGIVTGPGSFWVVGFINALLANTAYLGNSGRGICNSIYIDNLVEAIRLAATIPGIDQQAFLVGDRETVTWADLYRPLANALGFNLEQLPNFDCFNYQPSVGERLREKLRNSMLVNRTSFFTLNHLKSSKPPAQPCQPALNYEMAMLYSCCYKLPHHKAQQVLGYEPIVPFTEGCDRTLTWLAMKGYPLKSKKVIEVGSPSWGAA